MTYIIEKDLCYDITGVCFKTHKALGRFCREKQYCDDFEKRIIELLWEYDREYEIKNLNPDSPKGNRVDFLIKKRVPVDFKAKNFITKEDYYQMLRYLLASKLEVGLIINFRDAHLKPKRVLNNELYSGHSDANSDNSGRNI